MSTNAIKVNNPMKVITGPDTRWSYANVWEPKSINGGAAKYSVSLIIPKSDTVTVSKIKAAIEDGKTFLAIATADGAISVTELQLAGKKRMPVKDFLIGFREPMTYTTTEGTSSKITGR